MTFYHRNGAETVARPVGASITVGRSQPADIVIPDPSLSRLHARLTLQSGWSVVEDLGSTNGTWVAGENVTQATVRAGVELRLGTVTAVLHEAEVGVASGLGLEGHGQLQTTLEIDVVRGRHFGRPLGLMMVASSDGSRGHVRHWAARVRALVRPVDHVAVYSERVLEVLVAEADREDMLALAHKIAEPGEPSLRCGVACFPSCAPTAQGLIEATREALRRATRDDPVSVAPELVARKLSSASSPPEPPVVSESSAFAAALDKAKRFARGVIPVLLQGETGSGKEVVARFIHAAGPRHDKPLLSINSAALPAQLIESALFGHEKGAFTSAHQRHIGVFEAADGGTVLLDRSAIFRSKRRRSCCACSRRGASRASDPPARIDVDVRIIAASHRDLEAMTGSGQFRTDLLYRLNAATIEVPPLRERREDIPPLARMFLVQANEANHTAVTSIASEAMNALCGYRWPGNVRELRNAIERAVLITEHNVITVDNLAEHIDLVSDSRPSARGDNEHAQVAWSPGDDFRAAVERFELDAITLALQTADGNQTAAAGLLRMPRRTLVHKYSEDLRHQVAVGRARAAHSSSKHCSRRCQKVHGVSVLDVSRSLPLTASWARGCSDARGAPRRRARTNDNERGTITMNTKHQTRPSLTFLLLIASTWVGGCALGGYNDETTGSSDDVGAVASPLESGGPWGPAGQPCCAKYPSGEIVCGEIQGDWHWCCSPDRCVNCGWEGVIAAIRARSTTEPGP